MRWTRGALCARSKVLRNRIPRARSELPPAADPTPNLPRAFTPTGAAGLGGNNPTLITDNRDMDDRARMVDTERGAIGRQAHTDPVFGSIDWRSL